MDELPKSIEYLPLVKYLNLSNSKVRRLPSSICRLCNLQILDSNYCKIEELPKEMDKLSNLRYLGMKWTWELKFIAEGLGKLTNLRMTKGTQGLGVTRKATDCARNAQLLKEKHGIISLEFYFRIIGGVSEQSGTSEQSNDEQCGASERSDALEALEPLLGLECLDIGDYKGKMPAWHLNTEHTKLHSLKLERCHL
uniref:Disease resistance R13L4/SHOC-2-like LRR domain-containing protein n=1 Tax=Nymphaea colorata TaxID=210225 RepID=A0A5K1HW79_9MAGN|nr:unnamed protein product [Nymphaea colorata]